jgi:hypothetical protein
MTGVKPYMNDLAAPRKLTFAPEGNFREVGSARLGAGDVERVFGEPTYVVQDERTWGLRASCGLDFALWEVVRVNEFIVCAEETAEFDHALAHLPVPNEVTCRWPALPDECARRGAAGNGWVVYRLDDRGNRFDLVSLTRESSARCYAQVLEKRGHKQSYFVERRGASPPPPDAEVQPFRWVLVRQDEHGNKVAMRRGASRSRLEFLAEHFGREPRHKQTYWVEALPESDV